MHRLRTDQRQSGGKDGGVAPEARLGGAERRRSYLLDGFDDLAGARLQDYTSKNLARCFGSGNMHESCLPKTR